MEKRVRKERVTTKAERKWEMKGRENHNLREKIFTINERGGHN